MSTMQGFALAAAALNLLWMLAVLIFAARAIHRRDARGEELAAAVRRRRGGRLDVSAHLVWRVRLSLGSDPQCEILVEDEDEAGPIDALATKAMLRLEGRSALEDTADNWPAVEEVARAPPDARAAS